jgi:hypothetical protein
MVLKWIQKNIDNILYYFFVFFILFYLIGCVILGVCKGYNTRYQYRGRYREQTPIYTYLIYFISILLIIYIINDIYRMSNK